MDSLACIILLRLARREDAVLAVSPDLSQALTIRTHFLDQLLDVETRYFLVGTRTCNLCSSSLCAKIVLSYVLIVWLSAVGSCLRPGLRMRISILGAKTPRRWAETWQWNWPRFCGPEESQKRYEKMWLRLRQLVSDARLMQRKLPKSNIRDQHLESQKPFKRIVNAKIVFLGTDDSYKAASRPASLLLGGLRATLSFSICITQTMWFAMCTTQLARELPEYCSIASILADAVFS